MRKFRAALLLLLCLLLLVPTALAADGAGVRANWTAGANGAMRCELTFTCTFDTPQQSVTIRLPEGAEKISVANHSSSKSGNTVTIKSGSHFSGQQTFRVSFNLPDALTRNEEGSQILTLPIVPADFGLNVSYVEYSLTLPKAYENEPTLTLGDEPVANPGYSLERDSLSGRLITEVTGGEPLTLTLDLGEAFFTTQTNHLSRIFSSWRLLLVALMALTFGYWYFGFFRGSRRPKAVRRAMAPDGAAASELPCLFYGGEADAAALLCEWASLGYIRLERDRKGRWTALPQITVGPERRDAERSVYKGMFSGGALRLGSERWTRLRTAAGRKLRAGWLRKLFDPKSGSPRLLQLLCVIYGALCLLSGATALGVFAAILSVPLGGVLSYLLQQGALCFLRRGRRRTLYLGIGAGVVMLVLLFALSDPLMFLAIVMQLLCAYAVCTGGRRSEQGAEALDQVLGFRKYLLELKPKQAQAIQRRDGQVFYRLLPYAVALNCETVLADKFRALNPEPCDWLDTEGGFDAFWTAFRELLTALRGQ